MLISVISARFDSTPKSSIAKFYYTALIIYVGMIIDKDDKYEWARVAIQNLVIVLFGMDIYRLNIG